MDYIRFLLHHTKSALLLGACASALAGAVLLVLFLRHRKKYGTAKAFPWFKSVMTVLLCAYLAVLLRATLLRGDGGMLAVNVHLFRAWREAWNSFSVKNWLNVLLNVALFLPLGLALPAVGRPFRRWELTALTGFLVSLSIEAAQYLCALGLADVDDLFCNTLGTVLGWCVFMAVRSVRGNRRRLAGYCALPVGFLLGLSVLFGVYASKEYGNLPLAPAYRVNTEGWVWHSELSRQTWPQQAAVYRARGLDQDGCDAFAEAFFEKLELEIHDRTEYGDSTHFANRNPGGFLFVNHADGNFTFTRPGGAEEAFALLSREPLLELLEGYSVSVPEQAAFLRGEDGWHCFTADRCSTEGGMYDGTVRCRVSEDGTVQQLENFLQFYGFYRMEPIITGEQALQRLQQGRFTSPVLLEAQSDPEVTVHSVSLEYRLDTKGFYRPVYVFTVSSSALPDGADLLIPAN